MNMKEIKIDPKKVLSIGVTVLGVAGTLLSSKVEANNRQTMKEELKNELLNELSKGKE